MSGLVWLENPEDTFSYGMAHIILFRITSDFKFNRSLWETV